MPTPVTPLTRNVARHLGRRPRYVAWTPCCKTVIGARLMPSGVHGSEPASDFLRTVASRRLWQQRDRNQTEAADLACCRS